MVKAESLYIWVPTRKQEKNVVETFMISRVPEKDVTCYFHSYSIGENLVRWPYITARQQVNVDQLGSHVSGCNSVTIKKEDGRF